MSDRPRPPTCFIGWDVGGWNCDRNGKSRDALCILGPQREMLGCWRGNLRGSINDCSTASEWIGALFRYCGADWPAGHGAILAIDTPLGFSEAFLDLATTRTVASSIGKSESNPYLFRHTEQFLFERGVRPLSPIKDMIGSQATKGLHVLAKFAPHIVSTGIWSDGNSLTAIEAYPSPCKGSAMMQELVGTYPALDHPDKQDALTCALIGYLFSHQPEALAPPHSSVPSREGWIWVTRDCFIDSAGKP